MQVTGSLKFNGRWNLIDYEYDDNFERLQLHQATANIVLGDDQRITGKNKAAIRGAQNSSQSQNHEPVDKTIKDPLNCDQRPSSSPGQRREDDQAGRDHETVGQGVATHAFAPYGLDKKANDYRWSDIDQQQEERGDVTEDEEEEEGELEL